MASLNLETESIWGSSDETIVYTQVFNQDHIAIFRFKFDASKQPQNIVNRIVTCFHEDEDQVGDASATFRERSDMRDAILELVQKVWSSCIKDPQLGRPNALVDVKADAVADANPSYSIFLDPSFSKYFQLLEQCQNQLTSLKITNTIDFASLQRSVNLGGHSSTTKITTGGEIMVFKGIDFALYLTCLDDEDDDSVRSTVRSWGNELDTLRRLSPHPNIQPLPTTFVTVSQRYDISSSRNTPDDIATSEQDPKNSPSQAKTVVCGHLMPYYSNGDVASLISAVAKHGKGSIPSSTQARWCYQITSAIKHVHDHGEYHKDIKPGNLLITSDDNILVIDWEQDLGPAITIAPEADGTWDVTYAYDTPPTQIAGSRLQLKYTKYEGPPRRNQPEGSGPHSWDTWNVFPLWQRECPLALELAEVFSLGRTMWMLLDIHEVAIDDVEHPDELVTEWKEDSEVPLEWRKMVDRCMSKEPNQRPRLAELEAFWRHAWAAVL